MPDAKVAIKAPKVNVKVPAAQVDIKTPEVNTKLPAAKINIKAPKVNVKVPSVGIKAPKLDAKLPSAKTTETDAKLPSAKVDIKTPKVDVKTPAVDGKLPAGITPNVSAKVEAKVPEVKSTTPSVEVTPAVPELDEEAEIARSIENAKVFAELQKMGIKVENPEPEVQVTVKPLDITPKTKEAVEDCLEKAVDKKATVNLLKGIQDKNARTMKKSEIHAAKAQAIALMARLSEQRKAEAELKVAIGDDESSPKGNENEPARSGAAAMFAACIRSLKKFKYKTSVIFLIFFLNFAYS